jgi:tungstate transport system ATP-binding protein
MDHIFRINDLCKEYNNKAVLNVKELNLPKEKITAVIGPSGSGKSTLLHLLNNIEIPTKGKIIFNDKEFPQRGNIDIEVRRQMVMAFQKPVVFNCSVFDNIAYSLKLRKKTKAEIKTAIDEISEIIGMKDKLKQNATTLSGGEAQRVTIARAIIARPDVLLLDEPTANLDPANITIIEELIKHANTSYKTSIIIVTHNMGQAKRLAHNTVFLLNGSIIEFGDTAKILYNPENALTKAFINGDMIY